jgi:hypothetical protein
MIYSAMNSRHFSRISRRQEVVSIICVFNEKGERVLEIVEFAELVIEIVQQGSG